MLYIEQSYLPDESNGELSSQGHSQREITDIIPIGILTINIDCNKYKMDLTTNGVVITDAIKFVQTNKVKLATMSTKDDNSDDKELKEPDYDEVGQEEKTEDVKTFAAHSFVLFAI
jgi:hypothetical protein